MFSCHQKTSNQKCVWHASPQIRLLSDSCVGISDGAEGKKHNSLIFRIMCVSKATATYACTYIHMYLQTVYMYVHIRTYPYVHGDDE